MRSLRRSVIALESDLPKAMLTRERHPDPRFASTEMLYRRFPPSAWEGGEVTFDAVPLPDISVMRGKYTHDARWVLLPVRSDDDFSDWGVASFHVEDIPAEMQHRGGVGAYTFKPVHRPEKRNYPHSEIQAFWGQQHLTDHRAIPPEVHMRFREKLCRKLRALIHPKPQTS